MFEANVSPTQHGRKPSSWPLSPREWRRPPHRPTVEGEHHIRRLVADRVRQATSAGYVKALLLGHIEDAIAALPDGHVGAPVLGRDTAERALRAWHKSLKGAKPAVLDGGAVAFHAQLGIEVGVDAASASMRLIFEVTPILRRPGRYRWVADLAALKACQPGDPEIEAIREWASRRAPNRVTRTPDSAAPESEPLPSPSEAHIEHACVVVRTQHSAAEQLPDEPENLGGLGCASTPPAEQAGASPATPPASDGDALLREPLTLSGWLKAGAFGLHGRRLGELLMQQPVPMVLAGSVRAVVDRLAREDGRWTARLDRAGLVRAWAAYVRRGLICGDEAGWRLVETKTHEALAVLGLHERPSATPASPRMQGRLERAGIDPTGLSKGEAKVVSYVLRNRTAAELWSYRQLATAADVLGQAPEDLSRVLVEATRQVDFEDTMDGFRRHAVH